MKHSKNHNLSGGFTFAEVVIAILMIGTLLTAVLGLQNTVFNNIVNYAQSFERIYLLQKVLFDSAFAHAKKTPEEIEKEQRIDDPSTTIIYEEKKIPQKSSLKEFENVKIIKATAQWQDGSIARNEDIITFLYKPEKKGK